MNLHSLSDEELHDVIKRAELELQAREQRRNEPDFKYSLEPANLIIQTFNPNYTGWSMTPENGVRIIHLPTGIKVECSQDRSQHKNKATCLEMLAKKINERKARFGE